VHAESGQIEFGEFCDLLAQRMEGDDKEESLRRCGLFTTITVTACMSAHGGRRQGGEFARGVQNVRPRRQRKNLGRRTPRRKSIFWEFRARI